MLHWLVFMIMLSVIMPVYNSEEFLAESVQSILKQSYADFELILIDNCSSDGSKKIIEEFAAQDPRVVPVFNDINIGLPKSLNKAMRLAKGKYIARMDADDIAHSERFSRQMDFLEKHLEIDVLGSWWEYFPNKLTMEMPREHRDIKIYALSNNPMGHPTVMFRREKLIRQIGLYNEDSGPIEDYEYWMRGLQSLRFANLPEVLLNYRIHHAQMSAEKSQEQVRASRELRVKFLSPVSLNIKSAVYLVDFIDGKIAKNLRKQHLLFIIIASFSYNLVIGYFDRLRFGQFLLRIWREKRNLYVN